MHNLTIAEIRAGDSVAITEAYIGRIANFNEELKAFTALDLDNARAAAAESAIRIRLGEARPLEGVPFGIKANIDVEGLATTAGLAARRDDIATSDAAVVALLRNAGAVILGHLNMHEGALGATTDNPAYGRTENPHKLGRTPGGSSGGSGAAVAAGLCAAALGTDTLGSVRIPAAFNGVYGLKPGTGLISDDGLVPLARRLDCIGPLARSIADLAAVMAVIAPLAAERPVTRAATLRAVNEADCEPAVKQCFRAAVAALEGLGITVVEAATLGLDVRAARLGGYIESSREAALTFAADRRAGGISAAFAAVLDFGAEASPDTVAGSLAAMALAHKLLNSLLETFDVLVTPTTPQVAFAHGHVPNTQGHFTALANIAGVPALSLPAGFDADGMPVGVQIIGRRGSEATLLALGARLDAALGGYRAPAGFR
ncbi:glutamyl-tRNA(Gln) amidotransferase subunit A [Polymorphobacter glacialis]|uniref:Glutamyl-tRNA(Gln) amidotransferase subunit A n=1 Tax=Sandarakinorhabdus glacialis TaxID=1614636 RepID=A0A916ZXB1_9SPHN|nr:amidase [Polymorphobacter glacialis]GGE17588.1 glutamyl-tRNA(Gln) amidotransferase subunit A [Polymorphobacter glacialis]